MDEAELPLIGVNVLERLVARGAYPEHYVTGGISAGAVVRAATCTRQHG